MNDVNEKLIKKAVVIATNGILGGMLGGGMGALIGTISTLDDGIISAGVDKLLEMDFNGKTSSKEEINEKNVNES